MYADDKHIFSIVRMHCVVNLQSSRFRKTWEWKESPIPTCHSIQLERESGMRLKINHHGNGPYAVAKKPGGKLPIFCFFPPSCTRKENLSLEINHHGNGPYAVAKKPGGKLPIFCFFPPSCTGALSPSSTLFLLAE